MVLSLPFLQRRQGNVNSSPTTHSPVVRDNPAREINLVVHFYFTMTLLPSGVIRTLTREVDRAEGWWLAQSKPMSFIAGREFEPGSPPSNLPSPKLSSDSIW